MSRKEKGGKKMSRKIVVIVLSIVALMFVCYACGDGDDTAVTDNNDKATVEESTEATEEATEATMEEKASGTYYFDYVMADGYTFNGDELYNSTGNDYRTDYIRLNSNSLMDAKIAGTSTEGVFYGFDEDYDSLLLGIDGYDFSIDVEKGTITVEDPNGVVMVYQK